MRCTVTSCKTIFSLATLLLTTAPLVMAQGTYTQFDVPGALGTVGIGIDTVGNIDGFYFDANGNTHGFLLSGGTYMTVDYPGGTNTQLLGKNDKGQIVGVALPQGASAYSGFVYDVMTQTLSTMSRSGATQTSPFSINNAGLIAGTLYYSSSQQTVGFELVGSKYVAIKPPGTELVHAAGISASGVVEVTAYSPTVENFLFSHGKYQSLSIPDAPGAELVGISSAGVVGSYEPSSGGTAGFLYQNKILTTLQFPGSTFAQAWSINDAGEVVGYFADSGDIQHGFTWEPPADAAKR
jgi:probable HAF family extracellular repeat protein